MQLLKTKVKASTANLSDSLSEDIDILGRCTAQIEPLKAQLKILEQQKREVESRLQSQVSNAGIYPGHDFLLQVSDPIVSTEISDKETLVNLLDSIREGLAFDLSDFKLLDLRKYLSKSQQAEVLRAVPGQSFRFKAIHSGG